jgi:hypothetical protein
MFILLKKYFQVKEIIIFAGVTSDKIKFHSTEILVPPLKLRRHAVTLSNGVQDDGNVIHNS